jgi:hypothetical protein
VHGTYKPQGAFLFLKKNNVLKFTKNSVLKRSSKSEKNFKKALASVYKTRYIISTKEEGRPSKKKIQIIIKDWHNKLLFRIISIKHTL